MSGYELVSLRKFADDAKYAFLIRSLPAEVTSQDMYNIDKYPDYPTLREALIGLTDSTKTWVLSNAGTSPMDVCSVGGL